MDYFELNIDGLVGPSHHYAGLSLGNLASTTNAQSLASPKSAALQGLEKMRLLHNMGLKQALLPPQPRPNMQLLRQCGFSGSDAHILKTAYQKFPHLVSACFSASSMWSANAATITPSVDSYDEKLHFTAANLVSNLHRHQEADFTADILKYIFKDANFFTHHPVLPKSMVMGDEGAANHSRLCKSHADSGVHLYVYGQPGYTSNKQALPKRYPARQSLLASQCVAQSHTLQENNTVFAAQNPMCIDEGVFHNDVIAVANEYVLMLHEDAYLNQNEVLEALQSKCDFDLCVITITRDQLSIKDAVRTYLFNSQLISLPQSKGMMLLAPEECQQHKSTANIINNIIADKSNPIEKVIFMDLKQSMRNGGGPACLRLRVPLNAKELAVMHQGVLVNNTLLDQLVSWVEYHYRDSLTAKDLIDPKFTVECHTALDALTKLLKLGNIYPFQRSEHQSTSA